MRERENRIIHGDCLDELTHLKPKSVALIVTSPPYAEQRKKSYGGIHPDKYVEWFMPRAEEMKRALRPDGTFVLNIKECVVDGRRHEYVRRLIDAMEDASWILTEEWIWHKKSCAPGKWPNRFRDAWERLLQFNLNRKFYMDQDAVRIPAAQSTIRRTSHLSAKDLTRVASATGSGFAKNRSNWVGRDRVYPSNVLHLASETGNKNHSAVFPVALPEFFVKLFSRPRDTVLDPFMGSGTTGVAAARWGRNFIGVEIMEKYIETAKQRIKDESRSGGAG